MAAFLDIWQTLVAVVRGSDYYSLGAIAVIGIAAGLAIQSIKGLVSATVMALIVLALVKLVLALVVAPHPVVDTIVAGEWKAFVELKALVLISYALIFAAIIAVVSAIRAAIS